MKLFNSKHELIVELAGHDLALVQIATDNKMFHMLAGDRLEMSSVAFKEVIDNVHDELIDKMRTIGTYRDCISLHATCVILKPASTKSLVGKCQNESQT